jgi:hypothetical protein
MTGRLRGRLRPRSGDEPVSRRHPLPALLRWSLVVPGHRSNDRLEVHLILHTGGVPVPA